LWIVKNLQASQSNSIASNFSTEVLNFGSLHQFQLLLSDCATFYPTSHRDMINL